MQPEGPKGVSEANGNKQLLQLMHWDVEGSFRKDQVQPPLQQGQQQQQLLQRVGAVFLGVP